MEQIGQAPDTRLLIFLSVMLVALVLGMVLVGVIGGKQPSKKQKVLTKKKARRDIIDAPESRWQRPGGPLQPQRKAPIFGEGKPRHVRIDNTPRVIIPHETYGPTGHASYQRNLPAVRIKPVPSDVPEQQPAPKADKPNKSNHTMPLKSIK